MRTKIVIFIDWFLLLFTKQKWCWRCSSCQRFGLLPAADGCNCIVSCDLSTSVSNTVVLFSLTCFRFNSNQISKYDSGAAGLVLALLSTFWCTKSASKMFVAGFPYFHKACIDIEITKWIVCFFKVLHMIEQRELIAFPIGLIYACFALMAVFWNEIKGLNFIWSKWVFTTTTKLQTNRAIALLNRAGCQTTHRLSSKYLHPLQALLLWLLLEWDRNKNYWEQNLSDCIFCVRQQWLYSEQSFLSDFVICVNWIFFF